MVRRLAVALTLAVVCTACSGSTITKGKDRVIDSKLSDEPHDVEGEHNPEFDHEAFLGEEAKTFDQLSPEESKNRLADLYERFVDADKDGKVTVAELEVWIRRVQRRTRATDVEEEWEEFSEGAQKSDKVSWNEYAAVAYDEEDQEDDTGDVDRDTYSNMQARDRKRWAAADKDGDGLLTRDEFGDFLHPEDVPHMQDIVVQETMEDIDKDKDSKLSLEEYIGDMYPNKDGEEEPDWVKTEREQFHSFRDKNADGFMDKEEVKEWIMPPEYDHADAEAKHLIHEADSDKDGVLTKEEVLEHHDVFVGSQATDFGEALTRHDEF